jgi:hypothetical protein
MDGPSGPTLGLRGLARGLSGRGPSGDRRFIEANRPLIGSFFSTCGVPVLSPRRLSKILAEASGGVDVSSVRDRIARVFPAA